MLQFSYCFFGNFILYFYYGISKNNYFETTVGDSANGIFMKGEGKVLSGNAMTPIAIKHGGYAVLPRATYAQNADQTT